MLRDLRERGMPAPRLVIGDGHLGIWGALRNVWPEADEQRCWNHKVLNVLERVPHRQQAVAERKRKEFEAWCQRHGYGKAAQTLGRA